MQNLYPGANLLQGANLHLGANLHPSLVSRSYMYANKLCTYIPSFYLKFIARYSVLMEISCVGMSPYHLGVSVCVRGGEGFLDISIAGVLLNDYTPVK